MQYGIIGGTGSVGQELVPVLKDHGHEVVILGRSAEKSRSLLGSGINFAEFDVNNASQSADPLKTIETVIYLVGVPYNEFKLHPGQLKVALKAAEAAGVRRFIFLSSLYVYGLPKTATVDETHPREPNSFKGRMRKEQEDLVLAAHKSGQFETLILRSPDFYGPTSTTSFMKEVFSAALEDRRASIVAPADTPHDFIFLPDLARAIVELSEQPSAFGEALNVTGYKPVTTQDFADQIFAQAGKSTKLLKAGKMMLRAKGWQDPIIGEIVEMHYLWTNPVLLNDAKARALIPHWQKTPYEDGIKTTLSRMKATERN